MGAIFVAVGLSMPNILRWADRTLPKQPGTAESEDITFRSSVRSQGA